MRLVNADDAWAAGKLGSSSVTVAILASGLGYDAPDLNGLVEPSRSASVVALGRRSALDLGTAGTDPYYGRGRIDVARALGL